MSRKRKRKTTPTPAATGKTDPPVLATTAALSTNIFQSQIAGEAIPDAWRSVPPSPGSTTSRNRSWPTR